MDKNLEKIIAIGAIGGAIGLIGGLIINSSTGTDITDTSNCDDKLKEFNHGISIHPDKVANLQRAYTTIKSKIINYFNNMTNLPAPDFYIQGSFKMKTIVENRNIKCDVDLALIFPYDTGLQLETLQKHVRSALWNHTSKGVSIKAPCVRLTYVKDFHIDLPIYFKDDAGKMFFGSKGNEWQPSDPKSFVNWFNSKTNRKPQIIRIIRYLKAWADHTKIKTGKKFPSGLALTLWAIEFYEVDDRDDLVLYRTCTKILKHLDDNFKYQWSAKLPVEPFDNVLNRLSKSQKTGFYDELKEMVSLMTEAVTSNRQSNAIGKWKRIFGRRFS